jgi:hypothetical protein
MATWKDVEKYIRSEYKVLPDSPKGMIAIDYKTPGGRGQLVFISNGGNEAMGDALQISSFIGKLSSTKLIEACSEAANMVVGGIVQIDDMTVLRHSVLLENLDENEILKPLVAITTCADHLEKKLTGKDLA